MEHSKKLKIFILRTDYYGAIIDGGVSSLYKGQVGAFIKDGYPCIYASGGKNYLPPECKYYYINHHKTLLNLPEIYNLTFTHIAAKKSIEIIESEKPDIMIQYHSIMNYSGTIIKRKTGIPFILHVDGVEYWAKQNWGRKLFLKKHLKWAEQIQWHNADIINVPSNEVKKMMSEYGANTKKVLVNPNGVDPEKFNPSIFGGAKIRKTYSLQNKYIIGFIGTFGQWHGADILAKSIESIVKKIPNAFILFVGDGLLRPKVEEILKKDGLTHYSYITGMLPYSEIPEYMSVCDVLTTPCVHNPDIGFFNSPVKLFEYMAMGKPIVATDVGQQSEVIEHEKNGLLCEQNSRDALADAIIRFYKDPDLAQKCGMQARLDAVEKYDWRVYNQRILDAYYKLINK